MRFADRVLFATGGASGLGEAAARRFADEGARIVVADIDAAGADSVAASLPDGLAVTVDTTDAAAVERAVAAAVGHYGRIDVIFNNAGVEGRQQPLHEMDVENWERVTAVDASGVFHVLKYGIAAMLETGGGSIINTSSTAGLIGRFIETAPDPAEMRTRFESFNPMPGIADPSDVAGVVAFLASDDARWITGVTIPIDGDYTAR